MKRPLIELGYQHGPVFEEDYNEDENDLNYWLSECGKQHDGTCLMAGTEECDWECPFSRGASAPEFEPMSEVES
jgi:hypothetical protein